MKKRYEKQDGFPGIVPVRFLAKIFRLRTAGRAAMLAATVLLAAALLSACGGGGGSGTTADGSPAVNEGVFLDSPVEGLHYRTETQSGLTDGQGRFTYRHGETIRFSIGDVVLGEAPAEPLMTPMHLAGEPLDEVTVDHPVVTNMARFIQSLDADADPENGITITREVMQEVSGRMIDFHQAVHDFETDAMVTMLFDTLNGLGMMHGQEPWHLRSAEEARQHMREHMGGWTGGDMNPGGPGEPVGAGPDGMDPVDGGMSPGQMDPGTGPGDGWMDAEMPMGTGGMHGAR